jgi:hypothetical protein
MVLLAAGVPWSVVWKLEDHERLAFLVIAGEINGGEFSWEHMDWIDPT